MHDQQKVHAAHRRNPDQKETSDTKCGLWNPVYVTDSLTKVTCGRCRRILAQEKAKISKTGKQE